MGDHSSRSADPETYDELTAGLRDLRAEAGHPSFSEIVLTIARQREARGIPRAAARPGRTTVYDAFQPGRRRINPRLVGEIVLALGVEEDTALEWEHRCRTAREHVGHVTPDRAEPGAQPAPEPAAPPDLTDPEVTAAASSEALPTRSVPEPVLAPQSGRRVVLIVTAAVLINVVGRLLVSVLELPLHLDMVGTALAAIVAGPWTGVVVAVLSSTLGVSVSGPVSLLFLPVNVAGALVWGYGVHRLGLDSSMGRFLLLTLATAVVCSLVAVPLLLLQGGSVGHGDDVTVEVAFSLLGSLPLAVLLSNLIYSVADKVVSGFLALALADLMPRGDDPPVSVRGRPGQVGEA